jgi:hypothetical protein
VANRARWWRDRQRAAPGVRRQDRRVGRFAPP